MSETIIYIAEGSAESNTIVGRLRKKGLHPFVLDNPDPTVAYKSFGSYKYRIAVPDDEAESARRIITECNQQDIPHAEFYGRQFTKQLVLSAILGAVLTFLMYLIGGIDDSRLLWFFGFTIVILIIISNLQAKKHKQE